MRFLRLLQFEPGVIGMATLRILSSLIELGAAIAIFYVNDVRKALMINSFLALVGPIIFITATSIGLISLASSLSFGKLLLIFVGVAFILIGILK